MRAVRVSCPVILVVLGAVTAARAQTPDPPTQTTACLPAQVRYNLVDAGQPAICWQSGCLAFARGAPPKAIARPRAVTPATPVVDHAEVQETDGVWQACAGTRCKKLGREASDMAQSWSRHRHLVVRATTDLKLVGVANTGTGAAGGLPLYDIAKDRPIAVRPRSFAEAGMVQEVDMVGTRAIVTIGRSEPPRQCQLCGQIVDGTGKLVGEPFFGGGTFVMLDDDLVAVLAINGNIDLRSMKTGKSLGSVVFGMPFVPDPVGYRLDAKTVVALSQFQRDKRWLVSIVTLDSLRGAEVVDQWSIDTCRSAP